MLMKWAAAAGVVVLLAVSTFELSCLASEPRTAAPSAPGRIYADPMGPDLPGASELEDTPPAGVPVLTH